MRTLNYFKSTSMLLTAWAVCEGQVSAPPAEPKAENGGETEIFSDNLVMVSREKDNYFLFTGNVEIHATNMVATCERLEVYASKDAEPSPEKKQDKEKKKEKAPIGKIERIMAIGKVRLIQQDRVATAGKAEIYPQEGRVVLLESPVVTDKQGTLTGYRITLLQGEQKVTVESGAGQRPKITLPQIPDLGIDGKKKSTVKP